MKRYGTLAGSQGQTRAFSITVGLTPGYELGGKFVNEDSLMQEARRWMVDRARRNLPFVSCIMSPRQDVIYAWKTSASDIKSSTEPVVVFHGELPWLYHRDTSDAEAKHMLNDLAQRLGTFAQQVRIYMNFNGESWVLQDEEAPAPDRATT